jgi:hypothetical protein
MKRTTLERIAPLLAELRRHPALREVRPAAFHVDGRDFLHFHDERDGIVADVRLARGFLRLPVGSRAEQAELLGRIDECLAALDAHVQRGGRRRERLR